MSEPAIYFAAPLFTAAERAWNAIQAAELRRLLPGAALLVPQEFCAHLEEAASADGGQGRVVKPDYAAIFRACVDHLDRSAAVVAVLDGADADSGTSWEVGYAFAKGITVIGLRTDWRPAEDGAANAMLTRSCAAVVGDVGPVAERLRVWLRLAAP